MTKKLTEKESLLEQKDNLERCIFVLETISNNPFTLTSLHKDLENIKKQLAILNRSA